MRATSRASCFAFVVSMVVVTACGTLAGVHRRAPNLNAPVPDSFEVAFETSRGRFDVMAHKAWAPNGVDRFYTLVGNRYYDGAGFYRVVQGFVAQFGMAADPTVTAAWRLRAIADEPVRHTNARGTVAYARGGPGTRTTQLYINLANNARLDTLNGFGFPAFGEVTSGMRVLDSLYAGYASRPRQDSIAQQGNAYLARAWPRLDYIRSARVVREWPTLGKAH